METQSMDLEINLDDLQETSTDLHLGYVSQFNRYMADEITKEEFLTYQREHKVRELFMQAASRQLEDIILDQ